MKDLKVCLQAFFLVSWGTGVSIQSSGEVLGPKHLQKQKVKKKMSLAQVDVWCVRQTLSLVTMNTGWEPVLCLCRESMV